MLTNHFDTIVVGAGVSGLTTARLLAASGQRVVVLEARERLGGRTWSEHSGRTTHDLGASWIHGIADSPLADLAAAIGMRSIEFTVGSYQAGGRPIAYFGPDARKLSDTEVANFQQDVRDFDLHLAESIAQSAPRTSYGDVVEQTLKRLAWNTERSARVREFMRHRAEEQYGVWIDDLDAHGLDDDLIDGDEVVFPEGYEQLAMHLAQGIDVRLGHVVRGVQWAASGVTVNLAPRHVQLSADKCVITVPIGVLKSDSFLITPPLPEPIAGAVDRLEMNAFEKVFLTFREKFWDENVYAIRRQGQASEWWHSWYDTSAAQGEATLLTFAAGPCARAIREWSDAAIADSVLTSLREIYGDAVTQPTAIRVTRWQDDPYSRGSYAYMTVGSVPEDHDAVATPVAEVLYLTGEATWSPDPATVTAALLSGHRAAEQVLDASLSIESLGTTAPRLPL